MCVSRSGGCRGPVCRSGTVCIPSRALCSRPVSVGGWSVSGSCIIQDQIVAARGDGERPVSRRAADAVVVTKIRGYEIELISRETGDTAAGASNVPGVARVFVEVRNNARSVAGVQTGDIDVELVEAGCSDR